MTLSLKELIAKLLLCQYPVGSYYETSDTTFDPNVSFGGTWELETEGLVHIGAGSNYTIGDTGGEATHKLMVSEMPSHNHGMSMSIVPKLSSTEASGYGLSFSSAFQNRVAVNGGSASIAKTGGGGAHNNMQPYIVVNRWHRTG